MMDPITFWTASAAIEVVVLAIIGYFVKVQNDKHEQHNRRYEKLQNELETVHRKEDARREVDRIDRDISNLRDDVSKGFDRLYETINANKKELLEAIRDIKQ